MKTNKTTIKALSLTLIFLGLLGLSSCGIRIKSQGTLDKRILTLSAPFSEIESYGISDIEYTDGDPRIVLYATAELIDYIKVYNKGEKLIVCYDEDKVNKNVLLGSESKLVISYPGVNRFVSLGTSDFEIKDLNGKSYYFETYGTGDFECGNIVASSITAESNGTGDIEIESAECNTLMVNTNGTGDIEVKGIDAGIVNAATTGTGDITLSGVCGSFSTNSSGTGSIYVNKLQAKSTK